jgi:serine phosphatase RsbU (regulator of sigma subunit)
MRVRRPARLRGRQHYTNEHHELSRGDVIVLMTDGVLEAVRGGPNDDEYVADPVRRDRGRRLRRASFFSESSKSARQGAARDDMTLVALEALADVSASNTIDYAKAS